MSVIYLATNLMTNPLNLREILEPSAFFPLLEELVARLDSPHWIEDERGEVVIGVRRPNPMSSEAILVEGQRMGQVKGGELGSVIARLVSYVLSQEILVWFDELTKIANRRYGNRFFEQEWKRGVREQSPLSLIMVDIDYFKDYNDYYGHLQGDNCLQQVAQILSQTLRRPVDFVARYGGEEFLIILPNTNTEGAQVVAERLRHAVSSQQIPHRLSQVNLVLTISLGIATTTPQLNQSPTSLLARADRALYRAKATGRNRYCLDINP